MKDSKSIHDDEWLSGWKSSPTALKSEMRFHLVSQLAHILPAKRVFDLGCGNGYQAEILRKAIPDIIVNGCDISPAAIEQASKRMDNCYTLDIDHSDLPEKGESYDLVLCIEVLEHLYDVDHALRDMHRILLPRKYILVGVPNLSFWKFRLQILVGKLPYILADPRHLHSFTKSFLLHKLQLAAFTQFQIYGQRTRLKFLASLSPSLFSEDLFILAQKL
jgi:2-polyprenyl-3-methyl-5-hydroxy-6-metoxy-1,4-benzoquinol methylase